MTPSEAHMEMDFGAKSDVGCVRENNEDSYRVASDMNLFVLSDGMGGLDCGEVASRIAVDTILEHCRIGATNPEIPLAGGRIDGVSETTNRLASAVHIANAMVHQAAQKTVSGRPMGATLVAVRLQNERMSIANVGDSRVYRLRGEEFDQLTRDHSFVAEEMRQGRMSAQEADRSGLHNVLVRALGVEADVEVDASEELVLDSDTILLCSDGLTRELSDEQIAAVLRETDDAQEATERLIELAKQAGGGDNVTAIVVRPIARSVGAFGKISKWLKETV